MTESDLGFSQGTLSLSYYVVAATVVDLEGHSNSFGSTHSDKNPLFWGATGRGVSHNVSKAR